MKAEFLKLALAAAFAAAFFNSTAAVPGQSTRPVLTPAPRPITTPVPYRPNISPSPTPTPTPAVAQPVPTPAPFQTLVSLRSGIQSRLNSYEARRGQIGVKIVSLNSGKVIFEQNSERYVMPASNMKNFTIAAALERLTPDFRFVTSVYANSLPDTTGTIKGDLRIYGRGDVSISTAFNNGDHYRGLDNLVEKILAAGVKRVEGDLIGDESYFRGSAIPGSWEYDDLQWYYGAEISALPLNDNAVDLTVKPSQVGMGCAMTLLPVNAVMRVVNRCVTTAAGTERTLQIEKKPGQNVLEITGALPVGNNGFSGAVTVSHPAELFITLLRQRLQEKGITVTGQARTLNAQPITGSAPAVEITKLESPPFGVIAAKTMKPSQNMYTETILWSLGEWFRARQGQNVTSTADTSRFARMSSSDAGIIAAQSFRTQIGIAEDAVIQHDGSGLSRHNLITPSAVVQLYTYMTKQSRFANTWRDSLTIAGVDGTLRNRLKGTPAAGNVRGKTGTIDQVSALSGYLTTAGGEPVVFSIVVNGVPESGVRTRMIDDIVLSLVNFNGNTDR